MKLQINQLFGQIHNVPQVPEVVRILITQLADPNSKFDEIAKNVEKEQVISMKVLRLANSAHFGLSKKIASIEDAVVMLGMSKLKTLIIASGIVSSVPDIPNFDIKEFWANSFRTATYAKWLAEEIKLDSSDTVFTAGLVSGLGTILLYLGAPIVANEIDQHVNAGKNRNEYEYKRLGFTNQEVSAELCSLWNFSDELVNTIAKSGEPLNADEISLYACVVYIARYISEFKNSELNADDKLALFPTKEWQQIGLTIDDIEKKLAEILTLESGLDGLID